MQKTQTFIIVALTLDGFIGRDRTDLSTRWTSKEDATWFSQRTKEAGICVMGRKTYQTFNRPLPERIVIVQTKDPLTFKKQQLKSGVEVKLIQADSQVDLLAKKSKTQVWATSLELDRLHQLLEDAGVKEVAVCGGSSIYTQWLSAGLVDELYLTLEPVVFGAGVKLFNQAVKVKLEFVGEKKLNDKGTKVMRLRVKY